MRRRPEPVEPEVIILPDRFVLTIRGELDRWLSWPVPRPEMAHMLTRLFDGETAAVSTFARWGFTVEVEEDTDQGPEA